MNSLVIIGSGGRLGAALIHAATNVVGFSRRDLDLACPTSLEKTLKPLAFDALINCAALTNVDYCQTHPDEARAVNTDAVRRIAEICERKHARCIHISTDYVFDGIQRTPYTEVDAACPLSVYGETKRQGEIELLNISPVFLAARVSWIFGPERPSFIDHILQCARELKPLQAIGDKWSIPTYTKDLATWLLHLAREKSIGGVLHLTQTGSACTWQEYAQHALDCVGANRTVGFQSLADMQTFVAPRPVYTALDTTQFTAKTGIHPRPWQEAVEEYVRSPRCSSLP